MTREVIFHDQQKDKESALDLIVQLCQLLDKERIAYCHWKSNAMLNRSACGQNDLDLLIDKADSRRFEEIIYHLGFIEAISRSHEPLPGISHYYGLDISSGHIVHLHRHYQLIVGHDLLKNHHLTLEAAFIESAIHNGLFKVPVPELELIVFVIRMILKRPLFLDTHLHRPLNPYAAAELDYLCSHVSMPKLDLLLQAHLPEISTQLWERSLASLQPNCSRWERAVTNLKLRSALRRYRRHPWLTETVLKLWRGYGRAMWVRDRRLAGKTLGSHGALIAIVGGDGAGKSTCVENVTKWLSKDFKVLPAHMGKPPRTIGTYAVELVVKIGNRITGILPNAIKPQWLDWLLALRPVCLAHDRMRLYERMQRFASQGGLVICDRYPLPCIKLMDGPKLGSLMSSRTGDSTAPIVRALARSEERYYEHILMPDILIVLKLAPEIAVQRKPEENADAVRKRSREIWELDWGQTSAYVVDASIPHMSVMSDVKKHLWQSLQEMSEPSNALEVQNGQ
jgi:thymidylate kinase